MAGELVYEISRYDASTAAEMLIERYQLHRDSAEPARLIAADPHLNEVRADQITRVTATSAIAAALPLVLTTPGERFGALDVNGERWASFAGPDGVGHLLPADGSRVALAQSWLRLSFSETGSTVFGRDATELGLSTPGVAVDAAHIDPLVGDDEPTVRVWQRHATPGDDAQIVLSWLQANALSDYLGVDTDVLVQLFIEAALNPPPGGPVFDGELLADLAGASDSIGTTPSSQWSLAVHLAPEVVEAVLDAIAASSAQRRYALIAARDPESPAGRVRRTLLAERER